jgi:RHS repeat-associated protein
MKRNGYQDGSDQSIPFEIDDLIYGYAANSNQLRSVYDQSFKTDGFKDGPSSSSIDLDYDYDAFGNLIKDRNKGIPQNGIKYNHLNLPTSITFDNGSTITYLYNAVGAKLEKKVSTTSSTESTLVNATDYVGGFQYKYNELSFFPTAEGYVNVVDGNKFNYVYNYTDHLGNIRLSYTQSGTELKIMEQNHYYPFGLKHSNYNTDIARLTKSADGISVIVRPTERSDYQYKYNGKEFQDELGLNVYDYGWRQYDPAIGRFQRIDRFAEKYQSLSPYGYAANNPTYYVDVQGDSLKVANTQITKDYLNSAVNKSNQKYIKYDDNGNVSLDFGDITAKAQKRLLKQDEGLAVINNMVNATDVEGNSENYYFEVSNRREGIDGDGAAFDMKVELTNGKSISGFETKGYEWFANYSTTNYSDQQHENVTPKAGIDGAVFVSPGKVYEYINGPPSPMGNYVKHELRENYIRTHEGKPYSEAHPAAGGTMSFSKFIFD